MGCIRKTGYCEMVGMKHIKDILARKTDASSLVEVTTALVLLVIIFGVALLVYFNVTTSSLSFRQMKYKLELDHLAEETILARNYISAQIPDGNVTIEKSVDYYNGNEHLLLLTMIARDEQGNVLAEYKRLIYTPDE